MGAVSLWYDGTAVISDAVNYNQASKSNLKAGEGRSAGKWGKGSSRKFVSRCLYMQENSPLESVTMCLTYRKDPSHKQSKKHLNAFLQWIRRRECYGYAYSVEMQERKKSGLDPAIHYHLLVSYRKNEKNGKWKVEANNAWANIRGDWAGNAIQDMRPIESTIDAAQYAAKAAYYASKAARKMQEGAVPKDVRLWGTSYNLVGKEKISVSNEQLRQRIVNGAKSCEVRTAANGFEYMILKLSRDELSKVWISNVVLLERERERAEVKERARHRKQEKSRQIGLKLD